MFWSLVLKLNIFQNNSVSGKPEKREPISHIKGPYGLALHRRRLASVDVPVHYPYRNDHKADSKNEGRNSQAGSRNSKSSLKFPKNEEKEGFRYALQFFNCCSR